MEPVLAEPLLDADGEATQEKWLVELDAEEALIEAAPAEAEGEGYDPRDFDEVVSAQRGGSLTSGVANLANSIVGAGIMALPHNFRTLGIVPGTLLLVGAYATTHLSMALLCRATAVCGKMDLKAVIRSILSPRWVLATQVAIILNNIGLCVVYLIIVGDVMSGSRAEPGLLALLSPTFANRFLSVSLVTITLVAPLCLVRRVENLRFTSLASMVLSFIFIAVTFVLLFMRISSSGGIGAVNWWPERGASVAEKLKTLPVFVTAYICHYNLHPIFAEMAAPTERRMGVVVRYALWSCTAVYWLVAISAYLLFTQRTAPDVLLNYGDAGVHGAAGRGIAVLVKLAYALSLCGTFPLIQLALRQSLFDLRGWGVAAEQPRRFVAVTLALLAVEYVLALSIPDISTAFGVLGSTVSVFIGFIVPAMLALRGGLSDRDVLMGKGLLVGGTVLAVVSFIATCVGLV